MFLRIQHGGPLIFTSCRIDKSTPGGIAITEILTTSYTTQTTGWISNRDVWKKPMMITSGPFFWHLWFSQIIELYSQSIVTVLFPKGPLSFLVSSNLPRYIKSNCQHPPNSQLPVTWQGISYATAWHDLICYVVDVALMGLGNNRWGEKNIVEMPVA